MRKLKQNNIEFTPFVEKEHLQFNSLSMKNMYNAIHSLICTYVAKYITVKYFAVGNSVTTSGTDLTALSFYNVGRTNMYGDSIVELSEDKTEFTIKRPQAGYAYADFSCTVKTVTEQKVHGQITVYRDGNVFTTSDAYMNIDANESMIMNVRLGYAFEEGDIIKFQVQGYTDTITASPGNALIEIDSHLNNPFNMV